MPDFRVFRPPTADDPTAPFVLSPAESHHLVVVNRARSGDPVVAFDGRGTEWTCDLVDARKNAAVLRPRSHRVHPPLPARLTLAQALPKGPAMEAIVRKATEIGAARIVPLETERTQVHLDGDRSDRKHEKWAVAALEAAKQCGNPFLPELAPLQSLRSFLAAATGELRLVASLHPGVQLLPAVLERFAATHGRPPVTAVWLVGPEGDFSPAEIAAALAAGFIPIGLGPLVLRAETAATAALAILSYELRHRTPPAPPVSK
jgi:16S rRNA (uracil1498-N3)-methyltransferase